ncbi:MAG: aminoglycoside phosphotransferase family protein [Oscillospiraceae bacterium]|nr:aminoglycoside phosphotransferase family protein [Oscillospiraceae bacterium]
MNIETLILVLNKMFCKNIINADYQTEQLKGGYVGDVSLITGTAETDSNEKLPYKVVLKVQERWERIDDPNSWRREYDLYVSNLDSMFDESFRWAKCYHAEINNDETQTQLWIEYINGVTDRNLTIEMLEKAAEELGRFQGRICAQNPPMLQNISCFSDFSFVKNLYILYTVNDSVYDYIYSEDCPIPNHLRQMLIDVYGNSEIIFANRKKLPVVLCHRDLSAKNMFYFDGKIISIDWDCAGWGAMGEDITQLILPSWCRPYTGHTNIQYIDECYRKLIPAYFKGVLQYLNVPPIENFYIWEMIILRYAHAFPSCYMVAKSDGEKNELINILQKLYDLKDIKLKI